MSPSPRPYIWKMYAACTRKLEGHTPTGRHPLNYMILSDSLEMVGVELKSSWVQSRTVNGDAIQARVVSTINAWKSGKFMDLSCRPWSINTYALSNFWFKCHTVDIRVLDSSSISSKVRSWGNFRKGSCIDQFKWVVLVFTM